MRRGLAEIRKFIAKRCTKRRLFERRRKASQQPAGTTQRLEDRTLLATFVVTNTNDAGPGSFRAALDSANAQSNFDRIFFNIPGSGVHTIRPQSPLPEISTRVLIDAATQPGYVSQPLIELDGTDAGTGIIGLSFVDGADGSALRGFTVNRFNHIGVGVNSVTNLRLKGNYIGTNQTGTAALPGQSWGVYVLGDTHDLIIGADLDGIDDDIEGNTISGNENSGIYIDSFLGPVISNVRIQGNIIGPDVSGSQPISSTEQRGIHLIGALHNTVIGGSSAAARNVISDNSQAIFLQSRGRNIVPEDTWIAGNFIGTNLSGDSALANRSIGIWAQDAGRDLHPLRTIIGTNSDGIDDALEGNLISGNDGPGISIYGVDTVVAGNLIGVDATGQSAIPNAQSGVDVYLSGRIGTNADGVSDEYERNVVSGNNGVGIGVYTADSTVAGNYVGTDITGMLAVPNQQAGVNAPLGAQIGGSDAAQRNVISGNNAFGVQISGGSLVGNFIGTNATGTAAIPNENGVSIAGLQPHTVVGGGLPGEGNVISGNTEAGIVWSHSSATVAGNLIGVDFTGENALPNDTGVVFQPGLADAFLGMNSDGINDLTEGNVIAGNLGVGIEARGSNTRSRSGGGTPYISGNLIGTTRTGQPLGNGGDGILVENFGTVYFPIQIGTNFDGISDAVEGNVIVNNGFESGNGTGLTIRRENSFVFGNYIGVSPAGDIAGNAGHGISIQNATPLAGGTAEFTTNTIQFNNGSGIYLDTGGQFRGGVNVVANNVQGAIEPFVLNSTGRQENFPVVTQFEQIDDQLVIAGFARPDQFIHIFQSGATPDGKGQGQELLITLQEGDAEDIDGGTGSYGPDVNGVAVGEDTTNRFQFEFPMPAGLTEGTLLAALGTSGTANASVFAPSFLFGDFGSALPPAIDLGEDATIQPGDIFLQSGSFSDPDSVSWTATVDYGDGSGTQVLPLGLFEFDLEHEFETPGTYTVTVNITDDSLLTTTETLLVTVQNDAPDAAFYTFDLTSPIQENEAAVLTGQFFDGLSSGNYTVDVDWGNGQFSQITLGPGDRSFQLENIYPDDTNPDQVPTSADFYEVTVTISETGGSSDASPAGVLVAEVRNSLPHSLEADFSSTEISEGESITLDLSFLDDGPLDTHSATIDWGDGQREEFVIAAGIQSLSDLEHTYANDPFGDDTAFVVTIEITDDDEPLNPVSVTQAITVNNPVPTNIVIENQTVTGSINENGFITIGGSFDDPGLLDSHLIAIDWGDGSGRTSFDLEEGVTTFSGITHQYLDDPQTGDEFTITVSVADIDSPTNAGTGTLEVTVNNRLPVLLTPQLNSTSVAEGDIVVISGFFTDDSPVDRHTVNLNWGDGTTSFAVVNSTTRSFEAQHVYADNPTASPFTYNITTTLTDDDGGSVSGNVHVEVLNVAPTVSFVPAEDNSDVTFVDLLSVVTDPGAADTFTYHWTASLDGNVVQQGFDPTFTLDRTNNLDRIFQVQLSVTDDDQASGQFAMDVQVGTANAETITLTNDSFSGVGDGVLILALGGDDVIDASAITDPNISLILDGGTGLDVLFGGAGDDVYVLANGNDAANTAPINTPTGTQPDLSGITPNVAGNDRYLLSPNSTLTVFDDLGGNALDFSRGDFGVTYDLSTLSATAFDTQNVQPATNTHFVRVQGTFNELVGSTFADSLTAADNSTVRGGAGNDALSVKSGTQNAVFYAGADDDTLVATGTDISSIDFFGDDGIDTLVNTGTITNLTFGGGADDDILQNNGTVLGMLDFNGDDGLDVFTNTGILDTLDFDGGADDDIFINNGPNQTDLDFGGDDNILLNGSGTITNLDFGGDSGADIFANLGAIETLTFGGGADDDVFINSGSDITSLDFGGDDDVLLSGNGDISNLDFNGDDGLDTLQNFGTIDTLTFHGGADDDTLLNAGPITVQLDFSGDGGLDALLNTGNIEDLNFNGGADDDLFINNGPEITSLNFGGDDEILLSEPGTVGSLDFNGDSGADFLVNLNAIEAITFVGGADDDVFINNGPETTSIDFGGDDDILLNGTGDITSLDFHGDAGFDTLINNGAITSIIFSGGADDDVLVNNGSDVVSLDFHGDGGADTFTNTGVNIGSLVFTGDDGLDTLTNAGEIATLNFNGGADDDALINDSSGDIQTLDFNGDEGIDILINLGDVTDLEFTGGADDDVLVNSGSVLTNLDFGGDDGLDTLVNSGTVTEITFTGGADDDTLINNADGVVTTLDFSGDSGADVFVNTGEIATLTFGGGADDDTLQNSGGAIANLDFHGDDGNDSLTNDGSITTLAFTGGADDDRLLNRQDGLTSLQFFGGGSAAFPLTDPESDGDDLFVNFGSNISQLDFNGDFGNDVLQNGGTNIGNIQVSGGVGNDTLINTGSFVTSVVFTGDAGDDALLNSGDNIGSLDFQGDDDLAGNDVLLLRGSGTMTTDSIVQFTAGDGINLLHNFATGFHSITFDGGDDSDIFVNEADGVSGLVFNAFDGENIFENAGNEITNFVYNAGDDADLLINTGNNVAGLTLVGELGNDAFINLGDNVIDLVFMGGGDDDQFENRGNSLTNARFEGGPGSSIARNSGAGLSNFVFTGGDAADTLINTGGETVDLLFTGLGGNDRFLNEGANGLNITFDTGTGADGFQNNGDNVSGITINNAGGDDTVINTGNDVGFLLFNGSDGIDAFRNAGSNLTNSTFNGMAGADVVVNEGNGSHGLTVNGGAGNDALTLFGADLGMISFNGDDGDDTFENFAAATELLVLNGGTGSDDYRNHGPVNDLQFTGGEGNDKLNNTATGVGTLNFGGGTDNDTLIVRGEVNSLLAEDLVGNNAFRIAGVVNSLDIETGTGRDSVEVYSSGSTASVTTAAGQDSISLTSDYANALIDAGADNDSILLSGLGTTTAIGGDGNDVYFFVGDRLSQVSVVEEPESPVDASSDTLNFSAFTAGAIVLDLRDTSQQSLSGLTFSLSNALGIENVIGTSFSDEIDGNDRDNFLSGADLSEPFSGEPAASRGTTQWVLIDFDSATEPGEHEYTPAERLQIRERIESFYHGPDASNPWFDVQFTEELSDIPDGSDFITAIVNQTPPSGRPGGLASEIDPGNRNFGGTATVQISGMLGGIVSEEDAIPAHDHSYESDHADGEATEELIATDVVGSLKPTGSSENYVLLTSKIIAHEVGHLLGLRHQDAFGPIGFGINSTPGSDAYNPQYTGPVAALETFDHIGGSPATVGTTRFDDLGDLFFGEREAIKLTAATSDPTAVNTIEQSAGHNDPATAQALTPALLNVPNTLKRGINSADVFSVQYISVRGQIDVDETTGKSQSDYYQISGSTGDVVTIELMSNSIAAFGSQPDEFIDSILRVYDANGELVPHYGGFAVNDDIFEPTDSAIFDLILPADGDFFIEVDTFARPEGDPLGDPENPDSPLNPGNPNNILNRPELLQRFLDTIHDTDVGNYELIVYSFRDAAATDGTNVIRGHGGTDEIIGGTSQDVTPPVSSIDTLPGVASGLEIPISVTGQDPDDGDGTASGVATYDIYVAVDRGEFAFWQTVPASSPSTTFFAESDHTYWFRSIATDVAGNVEDEPTAPDTHIVVGDFDAPETHVLTAVDSAAGLISLTATGFDDGSGFLSEFQFFVSIDDGAPQSIGTSGPTDNGDGTFNGQLAWQAIVDGTEHSYRFFTNGVDSFGNTENAPVTGDVTLTATFATAGLEATAIDVQKGANQRSFIRYVDVTFNTDAGVSDLNDTHFRIERFALDEDSPDIGTGTVVAFADRSAFGNIISFDFGAGGIGGNGRSAVGNGFYRISVDSDADGVFNDQHFEFARILGDANGDGTVNTADMSVVLSQYGQRGTNLDGDITGDGRVNVFDRIFTLRNYGQKLDDDLLAFLDD